ncbi:MAG: hypothetical protein H0V74_04670 [Chloroflexi bacterium]|nr:hypothetical protein [Chloroflexota bacterium]
MSLPRVRDRLLAGALVAGLAVAGCSGGTTTSTGPGASPSVSAAASSPPSTSDPTLPLPTASASPSARSGSAVGGLPSVPPAFHADPALEATLPATFAGKPLLRFSLGGALLLASPDSESSRAFASMVADLGAGPEDVSMAIANEGPPDSRFTVAALRVVGADESSMLELYQATTLDDEPDAVATEVTLAGKAVVRMVKPGDTIPTTLFYARGDTLYLVQAPLDLAEQLLPLLP